MNRISEILNGKYKKIFDLVRWILFIPLSILVALVIYAIAMLFWGRDETSILHTGVGSILKDCIFFMIINWCAFVIVPKYKKRVCYYFSWVIIGVIIFPGIVFLAEGLIWESMRCFVVVAICSLINQKWIKSGYLFNV